MEPEEEPQQKRPHLNNTHSSMARHSSSPPPDDNRPVDAAVLQYQNQKLVQQIETQKQELHDLESKIKELKEKQTSYDEILIQVNFLWTQLIDIILLGAQAGAGQRAIPSLDRVESSRGSIPSCPSEDIFLCRLLETDAIKGNKNDESIGYVEEALAARQTSTRELMKLLEDAIDSQRAKFEGIADILLGKPSTEDAVIQLRKLDGLITEEASCLHKVADLLHFKHKQYADEIQTCIDNHSVDRIEIKRLAGELEESMAELEESRRKLINLKMQKDGVSGMQVPIPIPVIVPNAVNGSVSPEKPADRSKRLRELKESIEDIKVLAEDRLSELQDAQEDNLILSKQLQDLQLKLHHLELLSSIQQDRHMAVTLEAAKWELADAEKELKMLKSTVLSSEKEHEQILRKIDEIQIELDNERRERKKLDEELMELNRTVAELTSETGEAAIQKLQEEIKDCKAILKCGVCLDRAKEVLNKLLVPSLK
ncbi:UNVERIFIED_CONTAM: E3 ubiquitin-protein ligase BRE1-like 2 [Sesamum radiatum]|uniref:E3 ubiquitin protein ligase n=1 Tax=Sesamum radiatum TaxID=300843 RepID=A0AAW2UJ98_SESRA